MLEHLLSLTKSLPVLLFVAGRPEQLSPMTRFRKYARTECPDNYTELLLGPLTSSDANTFIDSLLSRNITTTRLRRLILDKAEGNPLFLEEIIHTLSGNRDNQTR